MTAGRGCDNVVEVPEAQPRRNEVGRLPCLDILPPSEWTYTSGPPPSARSTRRRARPWRGGSAATRGARSRSGCRASPARRSPPTRAATSASRRRGSCRPSASTASSRPSPRSRGRRPTSRPRTTATTRPGWPRRYCRTTSPRYGCRPPRSRGSGTSPGPTTRRPRGSRRRSSGSWRSWPAGATPTAARRRPETPGGTGRTTSSGGSTRSGPPTTAASGRLRR